MRIRDCSSDVCSSDLPEARDEGVDHRVAGAGNVVDLARFRLEMAGCAGGSDERHALLAARREQRAEAGPGDQLLRRRYNGGGVAGGKAAGLLQLTPVRRHPGSAPITGKVAPLGIPHHRAAEPFRRRDDGGDEAVRKQPKSEEHTSELQSLMRISYAVFCLKKKQNRNS